MFIEQINPRALEFDGAYLLFEVPDHQFRFSLRLDRSGNDWEPKGMYHEASPSSCPYCGKKNQLYCHVLQEHIRDIFEAVREQPKVRIALLF